MPRIRRLSLRPFGAHLAVTSDDERVIEACRPALARFPDDAGCTGSFHLDATTVPDGTADPAWPLTRLDAGADGLELWCGTGHLRVELSAGTARLALPPALLAEPDAVRMFVEGALSSLLIGGGQLHAVHSGLVARHGRSLLLRGPSGAGKSTLTYAALRAGFQVVSDDWVYGVAGRPPTWLWGYPWRVFLVADAAARFPELAGVEPVAHPGADRWKIPVEPPPARRRKGARVDAVVFLDPDGDLGLDPVELGEARRRFWDPALPTERRDLPASWIDELIDRPRYVLRRGIDPEAAVAALDRLTRTLPAAS